MRILKVVFALSALLAPATMAATPSSISPRPTPAIIVLPFSRGSWTSGAETQEATRALTAALRKKGLAVGNIDPSMQGARTCLAGGSATACAAATAATGARYVLAGSLQAFTLHSRAGFPIHMTLTLLDVRSGRALWKGEYGPSKLDGWSGAISTSADVQLGSNALAESFAAAPISSHLPGSGS